MKIVFEFRSSRMVQLGLILAVVGLVFSQTWILALGIGIGIGSSVDFDIVKGKEELEVLTALVLLPILCLQILPSILLPISIWLGG